MTTQDTTFSVGDLVKLSPMCYDAGTTETDKCFIVMRDFTIEEEAKATYDFMAEVEEAGNGHDYEGKTTFTLETMVEKCKQMREEQGNYPHYIAADLDGSNWLLKEQKVGYAANRLRANGWQTFWNDAAFWDLRAHSTGTEEVV